MSDSNALREKVNSALLKFQGRQLYNTFRAHLLAKTAQHEFCDLRVSGDVLRAAVVFLHAAVEDCLRNVAADVLPTVDGEFLDEVPLLGSESRRAERFLLGRLVEHRKRTVQELIAESVKSSLENSTFNNTDEVCKLLRACNIDIKPVAQFLPEIQAMMKRRHQIVHRADFKEMTFAQHSEPEPLNAETVIQWVNAAQDFILGVGQQVVVRHVKDSFAESNISVDEATKILTEASVELKDYILSKIG